MKTINEVREELGYPAIPGGEEIFVRDSDYMNIMQARRFRRATSLVVWVVSLAFFLVIVSYVIASRFLP